jgi:gamma-glutamyl hydrolase
MCFPACPAKLSVKCVQADLHDKLADATQNIALQNHEYGMPPEFYQRWPILSEWYSVLSTSKDRNGLEYISTMEGKKYPFTGELGCRLQDW